MGIQIGRRMSCTSSAVTSEIGLESMGSQCPFECFHMRSALRACRGPFRLAAATLMSARVSKHSPKGGIGRGGARMFSPSAMRLALSKALWRAIFRVTTGWEPSPVLRFFPLMVKLCLPEKPEPATGSLSDD